MSKTLVLAAIALAGATASADSAAPAPAPAPLSVYRFDVSITNLDTDPKAPPATYSVVLDDEKSGTLEAGANVPLSPATGGMQATRMNIGVKLGLRYRTAPAGAIVVNGDFELTTADSASSFHRIRAEGATAIASGTASPTQLASVYDPQTHRRYDITVTAHRVL
jgi:hypothetical protein